tara:strand:- start:383 stop:553 length:171 start_codon:yes stop_codon:yes gene_type:complete
MLTKEQVETLIEETQIKEKLNSPRQVLEKYPELNAIYSLVCVTEADETKTDSPQTS